MSVVDYSAVVVDLNAPDPSGEGVIVQEYPVTATRATLAYSGDYALLTETVNNVATTMVIPLSSVSKITTTAWKLKMILTFCG